MRLHASNQKSGSIFLLRQQVEYDRRALESMKIILFLPSLTCGGAERVAIVLARGMMDAGCDVSVVVVRKEGEFIDLMPEGARLMHLGSRKPLHATSSLAKVVASERPDAVIAFGIQSGIAAAISKTRFRWKSVLIVRNETNLEAEWTSSDWVNRLLGPLLSRWVARRYGLVCVSDALSEATARYLKVPKHKITSILNPVMLDHGSDGPDTASGLHPWLRHKSSPVLVAMGRLEIPKGFDVLIDAFAIAAESIDMRLIIFGNGSLRCALEKKVVELGLKGRIELPGFVNNPMEQMRAADAFVLSSRYEGFGLVLAEAISAGVPVISTNCDFGPNEILEGGRYGALCPVGNAGMLAGLMVKLARGENSYQVPDRHWFHRFAPETAVRKHLALIAESPGCQ